MKTTKYLATTLLATTLFVACSKDSNDEGSTEFNDGRLHLFFEKIDSNTKVLVDPTSPSDASWVAGEQIDLNGTPCTIACTGSSYYLDGIKPLNVDMYAIYPASINANGNDIAVTNNGATACAIDVHSYAIDIHPDDGTHDVIFPMAAHTTANGTSMLFYHLTGGLKLTLSNTTGHHVTRLVVSATKQDDSPAIYKDLSVSWSNSTVPGVPGGEPGSISGDQSAQFISDMTLMMNTNDGNGHVTSGVDIEDNGNISFCIPMLAQGLKNLTIDGYNGETQIFHKTKVLTTATNIERNKMYNIPTIIID